MIDSFCLSSETASKVVGRYGETKTAFDHVQPTARQTIHSALCIALI
jgi:hypothetical protein